MNFQDWTSFEMYGHSFNLSEENETLMNYVCRDCGESYSEEKGN